MLNLNRGNFQAHPFHIVSPSLGLFTKKNTKFRAFSVSSKLQGVDPGSEDIDSTQDLWVKFEGDKKGADEYFTQKRDSISKGYRGDSNSGAASGVGPKELEKWLNHNNSLLDKLDQQKEDVMDELFPEYGSSQKDDSKNDDSKNDDSKQDNSKNNGSGDDETGHINPGSSSNNQFKQDSSGVYPTDFSSSEPFDD